MKALYLALLLLPSLALAASQNDSSSFDSHIRGSERVLGFSTQQLPRSLEAGTFQQDVDHSGLVPGQKFSQRYWAESSYAAAADAPVLYHICGEGDATQGYFLNDNAIAWAKSLGARIVYLEHRYYGQSQPFSDLSTDHMKYLTLDNVIEDLATFQKSIAASRGWTGKWISLGGSYSGTISAIYRQKHPELVVGALAASAPMLSGVGQMVGDQGTVDQYSSTDLSSGEDGGRPWIYQACTTFGFWQAEGAYFGSQLDLPSSWLCQQLFGNAPQVNYSVYNQTYDQPFISNSAGAPSNIMFTYGSNDVWTGLGLSQQTNANAKIVIYTIDGAGHHFDLNPPDSSDSSEVVAARSKFEALMHQWLGQ